MIDVTVTDSKDRPVTNLTQQDFQVFENGVLQEIRPAEDLLAS